MKKYTCRCGREADELRIYFTKNGSRATLCEFCANRYGLTNEKDFSSVKYNPKENKDANNQ